MFHNLITRKNAKRFGRDERGNFTIMLALAAVPVFVSVGAAIDMIRYNDAQTHVQASLDAGALAAAAGKKLTDAERIAAAEKTFDANMASGAAASYGVTANFKIIDEKIVSTAAMKMPTSFMAVAGITEMNGTAKAEVNILTDKKAEVALVLDYSGSMEDPVGGKVKYVAMREAAKSLVDDLAKTDPDKVKFGLVPFSHQVYTTMPSNFVVGGTGGSWTGCTQDRRYPFNLSDSTPSNSDNNSKWNQPMAPEHAAWGCNGYAPRNLKTIDLTDNFKGVTNQLDIMKPYAWTHIALGVEFGYHLLSPNAPYTSGASYNDKETMKFMVVLTDGMQTEPGFGPGGVRDVAQGEKNLEKLCDAAKANKITMITMAFDLDDSGTRQRLQNCASDPNKYFFVVNDPDGLSKAFNEVKQAITAEVFLSK
jgi:Flp pilus assembly protein TadG